MTLSTLVMLYLSTVILSDPKSHAAKFILFFLAIPLVLTVVVWALTV